MVNEKYTQEKQEVVGNLPMVFIAMNAKGTFGISRCNWI